MKVELESKEETGGDESNMTDIKEFIYFGLIIRKGSQETFEEEGVIRNWFTGYITLLNLTVNNGTNDMFLKYNKKLKDIINENTNRRILRESNNTDEDNLMLNDEDELCFVKIHFYENGEIKDIQF